MKAMRWHDVARVAVTVAAVVALPAAAAPVSFTFSGQALSTGGGYEAGDAVSFTFTLRDVRPESLRVSPEQPYPPSACCAGGWGWYQDLWNQAHLWGSITGTGLSGAWNPVNTPAQTTTSALTVTLPHTTSNALNLNAFDLGGSATNTGLLANGHRVMGFEVAYSFLGLDVLDVIGDDQFSHPVPDPTELFGSMAGHYDVDPIYSFSSRFWLFEPGQGSTQVRLRFTGVDISTPGTTVPEPATAWMVVAAGALMLRHRRRKASDRGAILGACKPSSTSSWNWTA